MLLLIPCLPNTVVFRHKLTWRHWGSVKSWPRCTEVWCNCFCTVVVYCYWHTVTSLIITVGHAVGLQMDYWCWVDVGSHPLKIHVVTFWQTRHTWWNSDAPKTHTINFVWVCCTEDLSEGVTLDCIVELENSVGGPDWGGEFALLGVWLPEYHHACCWKCSKEQIH